MKTKIFILIMIIAWIFILLSCNYCPANRHRFAATIAPEYKCSIPMTEFDIVRRSTLHMHEENPNHALPR